MLPQMALADAQQVPVAAMHTPPLQSEDVEHPPSWKSEPPPSPNTVPSWLASLGPPPPPLFPLLLEPHPLAAAAAANMATEVKQRTSPR
jgi:hypothetical protein